MQESHCVANMGPRGTIIYENFVPFQQNRRKIPRKNSFAQNLVRYLNRNDYLSFREVICFVCMTNTYP